MIENMIFEFAGVAPQIADNAFIAPGCRIVGDVHIGPEASIWYGCMIRADVNQIRIGARTNIQDGSIIHCDAAEDGHPGYPTIIGEDCLVGHMVLLHGCTLEDRAFAGMGSIVLNGARIEGDGMLAAGAMLTSGKIIRSGQLWAGRPAKYLRDLTPDEIALNRSGVNRYVQNGRRHATTLKAC